MSLPPVVSDPERCPVRQETWVLNLPAPHDWQHMDEDHEPTDYWQCRFCGGRKPPGMTSEKKETR